MENNGNGGCEIYLVKRMKYGKPVKNEKDNPIYDMISAERFHEENSAFEKVGETIHSDKIFMRGGRVLPGSGVTMLGEITRHDDVEYE